MQFQIIKKAQQKSSNWGGGQTTECFIYPPESDYKKRNFLYRLSTATIEVWNSEFTALPNVYRKLMVLDGVLYLNHNKQRKVFLRKFDFDEFMGDQQTTSEGKCVDFNFMATQKIPVEFKPIVGVTASKLVVNTKNDSHHFLFVHKGRAQSSLTTSDRIAESGDLVVFEPFKEQQVKFDLDSSFEGVLIQIILKNGEG